MLAMLAGESLEGSIRDALEAHRPRTYPMQGARAAAVLIPVVGGSEPSLIFTLRTDTVRSHPGQISFPGGAIDPDDASPYAAARREASEEIGLQPEEGRYLGELDTFPTFVSGFVVTPFLVWLDGSPELRPNPAEVAEVIHVPIAAFRDEIREDAGFILKERTYPTEAWIWEGHVIWGVTGRIMRELLQILGEAGVVDPPGGDGSWIHPNLS
jgi:8-oxo-dGTP pyrophosphatase MutT (NUDIX family)